MKYNYHREIETLEQFYQEAIELIKNQALSEIEEEIKDCVDIFVHKIETDKSLIQVIITSLLKKIIKPVKILGCIMSIKISIFPIRKLFNF